MPEALIDVDGENPDVLPFRSPEAAVGAEETIRFDPDRIRYFSRADREKFDGTNIKLCEDLNAGRAQFKVFFKGDFAAADGEVEVTTADLHDYALAISTVGEVIPLPLLFEAAGVSFPGSTLSGFESWCQKTFADYYDGYASDYDLAELGPRASNSRVHFIRKFLDKAGLKGFEGVESSDQILEALSDSELLHLHEFLIGITDMGQEEGIMDNEPVLNQGGVQAHLHSLAGSGVVDLSYRSKFGRVERIRVTTPLDYAIIHCLPLGLTERVGELDYLTAYLVLEDTVSAIRKILQDDQEDLASQFSNVSVVFNQTNPEMAEYAQKILGFHQIAEIGPSADLNLSTDGPMEIADLNLAGSVFATREELVKNLPSLEKKLDRSLKFGISKGKFKSAREARIQAILYILDNVL